MNLKANISKILSSSILLRVIFILSFFNIIGYIVYGDFHAIIFFLLIAGLVKYFSRNMILILGIPLFVVNLFIMGKSVKEGMENSNSNYNSNSNSNSHSNNSNNNNSNTNNQNSSQDPSNNTLQNTINKINEKVATKQGLPITPVDDNNTSSNSNGKIAEESFEVGRNKKGKYDIDYASTIEDAYDELNNILGSDGIKNLTTDTQNLMKQQKQLTEAMTQIQPLMQTVGPLLDQAKSMMNNMQQSGGVDQLNKLAKQFNPSTVTKQ
jgi:hypothetical protein